MKLALAETMLRQSATELDANSKIETTTIQPPESTQPKVSPSLLPKGEQGNLVSAVESTPELISLKIIRNFKRPQSKLLIRP